MCTPLATATDSLILLVSLCPQDACASVDVLSLFDHLHCIALLAWLVYCIYPSVYNEYKLLPFSPPPYQLVYHCTVWTCIFDLYCVFAYTPQSTVSTGFTLLLTHLSASVFVFLLQDGRSICVLILCIITCLLPLTLTFIVDHLSASTIVEGSRPCPHPYNIFSVEASLVFASYCWLIVGWLWRSLCCSLIIFPVSKLFFHLLFYLALQLNYYFPSPTYLVFDVACTYLTFKLFLPYPLM